MATPSAVLVLVVHIVTRGTCYSVCCYREQLPKTFVSACIEQSLRTLHPFHYWAFSVFPLLWPLVCLYCIMGVCLLVGGYYYCFPGLSWDVHLDAVLVLGVTGYA